MAPSLRRACQLGQLVIETLSFVTYCSWWTRKVLPPQEGVQVLHREDRRDSLQDVRLLQQFVAERGKIVPRRLTGVCTTHQRRLIARHQAGAQHRAAAVCHPALN